MLSLEKKTQIKTKIDFFSLRPKVLVVISILPIMNRQSNNLNENKLIITDDETDICSNTIFIINGNDCTVNIKLVLKNLLLIQLY